MKGGGLDGGKAGEVSRAIAIDRDLAELSACFCDPHPTDDQLHGVGLTLEAMVQRAIGGNLTTARTILERMAAAVTAVRRLRLRYDERTRTILVRGVSVLEEVLAAALEVRPCRANVRQCLGSLDTLLVRAGVRLKKRRR